MLNFLTKTTPLLVVSLLAATAGFAQDNSRAPKKSFDQGLEMPTSQTLAAHSYPARQEVRGSWNVYAGGSYILWQASQDNMDLGVVSNSPTPSTAPASTSTFSHANFGYKSGFKADFGVNLDYDNWDAFAEYTWFHGTTHTNVEAVAGLTLFPSQVHPTTLLREPTFTAGNQAWNLKMDFADLSLARSFYSGTKFTMRPFFGARGAWIRQTVTANYTGLDTLNVETKTISQGIGPRTGVNSNWLLGYGLRLVGNASADILYTRYNYKFNQTLTAQTLAANDSRNDALKAHTDLELGLGWGSYFDNNNWYLDLSANYGFQVFWNQNMARAYGATFGQTTVPNGNLYVHGLTVNAALDF